MAETLEIQNFAGIKSANVELKAFNILIGPQSAGKSVIAKLFFCFKKLLTDLPLRAEQLRSWSEFQIEAAREIRGFFSPSAFDARTVVNYRLGDLNIGLKVENGVVNLFFNGADFLKKKYEELKSEFSAVKSQPDPDSPAWRDKLR